MTDGKYTYLSNSFYFFYYDLEHFIVWMRNSGLPTFNKLWGHTKDLKKGKYKVEVQSNYAVHHFNGEKHFVIS